MDGSECEREPEEPAFILGPRHVVHQSLDELDDLAQLRIGEPAGRTQRPYLSARPGRDDVSLGQGALVVADAHTHGRRYDRRRSAIARRRTRLKADFDLRRDRSIECFLPALGAAAPGRFYQADLLERAEVVIERVRRPVERASDFGD